MTTAHLIPQVRRVAVLLGALLAVAVPAAAADAKVYCVHDPDCPAGGIPEDTLNSALTTSDADVAKDTVRVGPGAFAAPVKTPVNPVDIVGAGMDATEIDNNNGGGFMAGFVLSNAASTVADLGVRLTKGKQYGVILGAGAAAKRVKVTASHSLPDEFGFSAQAGSDLQSVVVDLGDAQTNVAIGDGWGATVSDSTLTAGQGISTSSTGTIARRVTVRATVPFRVVGGTLNVANALVVPHPDDPQSSGFIGAEVENSITGQNGLLNAADLTIAGGGHGTGVWVRFVSPALGGAATANVQGAIIHGVDHSLDRHGQSITEPADITIDHSAYDAGTISESNGGGAITDKGGNLTNGPDPKFVDPAAGDYRLRFDSPLLDKGPPTEPLSGDDPDLAGRSRVRDSDGNGSAVRDIGAYEYQRLAPTATFALQPDVAQLGQPTAFDATQSSDPDGDPVSFTWAFGDGATGSGATTSHTYGSPGSYQTTLTATDATGLSATATHTASVASPSAPSGSPSSGSGTGSDAGSSPGSSGTPASSSPPTISGLAQSATRWLERRFSRTRRLPVGTTFRFSLDQAADVRFAFTQTLRGRSRSGKCVSQNRRNATAPRCWRTVTAGTIGVAGHPGANQLRFRGRLSSGRTLKPGRYTLTATATNIAGQHSDPRSLTFTIAKR